MFGATSVRGLAHRGLILSGEAGFRRSLGIGLILRGRPLKRRQRIEALRYRRYSRIGRQITVEAPRVEHLRHETDIGERHLVAEAAGPGRLLQARLETVETLCDPVRVPGVYGGLVLSEEFAMGATGGAAGLNEFVWDGRNGKGDFVSSGGYLVVVTAEGAGETLHVMRRKVAVVR